MTKQTYDLIVLGAGSGGLVVAEFAARQGAKVALVDKNADALGGQCLSSTCLPSKVLINASKTPKATWKSAQEQLNAP